MEFTDAELTMRQIASRLIEERLKVGITPEAFAKLAGVSKTSQFYYEKGERLPDALYLGRLWLQEGIDIVYILTGQRERKTEGVTPEERTLLDRRSVLPPNMRAHVDSTVLYTYMAYQDRKNYPTDWNPDAPEEDAKPAAKKVVKPKKNEPLL